MLPGVGPESPSPGFHPGDRADGPALTVELVAGDGEGTSPSRIHQTRHMADLAIPPLQRQHPAIDEGPYQVMTLQPGIRQSLDPVVDHLGLGGLGNGRAPVRPGWYADLEGGSRMKSSVRLLLDT